MEEAHEHTGSAEDAAPPPVLQSSDTTIEVAERSAGEKDASAGPTIDTPSSRPKTRKRGRAPNAPPPPTPPLPLSSSLVSVKPEPVVEEDEGANNESALPQRQHASEFIEGEHEGHQLPPTSPGVATRRSKHHELTLRKEENTAQKEGESDGSGEDEVQGSEALVGRSSSSSSSDNEDRDNMDSMDVSRVRRSSSRSRSALPMTPTMASSTTQRSASLASTAGAATKAKPDEALEALTQAGIAAQERQLRHTLLSIFPAHLRTMPPTFSSSSSETRGSAPPCSPEPLLPLLEALCEDKTYVHAAWCRYEDDVAVQRMQNSIQRKRQRHSFSKGGRKAASATANSSAAAAASGAGGGGRGESESESDGDDAGEEHQPPQAEWVEAPPALVGPPRTSPRYASAPTSVVPEGMSVGDDASTASASGFQWTPWRFFREKRLRSSRRPQGSAGSSAAAASAAAVGTMASASTTTASSASASGAASSPSLTAPVTTTVPATTAATTTNASIALTAPTVAAVVGAGVGGVPPLIFSEVPSLPVQQVDAEVPEDATATVPAMTAEEQRTYARYVMSSGKLRNVCRDPYTFLVTRAKEMRIQWERQHPFE